MRYRLAKQQFPVARQHDAFFARGDVDDFTIVQLIVVSRVESEHAQAACQLAEIDVDHESRVAQRFRPQALQRGNIETFEHRVYRHAIAVLQLVVETHGLVVNQDQVDFAVRHPEHFDRVLDRGLTAKAVGNALLVILGWEEVVEFLVETKICQMGFQVYNPGQQSMALT